MFNCTRVVHTHIGPSLELHTSHSYTCVQAVLDNGPARDSNFARDLQKGEPSHCGLELMNCVI